MPSADMQWIEAHPWLIPHFYRELMRFPPTQTSAGSATAESDTEGSLHSFVLFLHLIYPYQASLQRSRNVAVREAAEIPPYSFAVWDCHQGE